MRRQIRELIEAARRRCAERSQPAARKMELPAAIFLKAAQMRLRRRQRLALRQHRTWVRSIEHFVEHHLLYPKSSLNPRACFSIRGRRGAKASSG